MKWNTVIVAALMATSLTLGNAMAQDEQAKKNGIFATVKEVFMKGSIDGKSLFMVYGIGEATADIKDNLKHAVDVEDLVDLGQHVYDREHADDYVDETREGASDISDLVGANGMLSEGAQHLAKWPLKSLKKIPQAYEVSFDNARESYYNAANPVSGVLKYSGHAVWANVKGAYFLVVEVPAVTVAAIGQMALGATLTVLDIPVRFVLQTAEIAFKATCIGVQFAWHVGTAVVQASYAILSSGIATSVTLVAAGGVAVFKGGKWLVFDGPRKFFRPVSAKFETDVDVAAQQDYANKVQAILSSLYGEASDMALSSDIGQYTSKFVIEKYAGTDKAINAFIVSVGINKKKVVVKIEATRKLLLDLKHNDDMSRREARANIEAEIQAMIAAMNS